MLQTPSDKATLAQMTDQAFRASDPRRAVEQLIHILDVQGVPRFFSPCDRTLLKGFQSFGGYLPGRRDAAGEGAHAARRRPTSSCRASRSCCTRHLRERAPEGVRMNVNFLGEAILGEEEAERRLQQYLQALQWPEIEVVSIKISTLYSQISPLAREHTVATLCDRLELLFRTAAARAFTRPDGTVVPKFVYLDMEEYRDKELTAEAFMRTLDRPGLGARAGGHRAAELHPRLVPHAAASSRSGRAGASPRAAGAITIRAGQRREHGDGARRGLAARLAAGALQDQARNRRQLQAHAPRGHAAGEPRRRGRRRRLAQPLRPRLRPGAGARAQRAATRCSSRCSKAWPTTSAARCSNCRATCCSTRRPAEGELHQRHRLPHPPARREHRPGELPAPRLQARGRQPGVAAAGAGIPRRVRRHRRHVSDAPRRTQDRQPAAGRRRRPSPAAGSTS